MADSLYEIQLDYLAVHWADTAASWPKRPETDSRYLSAEQLGRVADTLLDMPGLLEDLDVAILKDVRFPSRPPRAGAEAESPLTWNPSASQARADLALAVTAAAIHVWNRLALGIHHRLADPLDAAEWLYGQLDRLALDPEAECISRRIVDRARHARNVIDHPRQTRYLGDCPDCGAGLAAEESDPYVLCPCGWSQPTDTLIGQALRLTDDDLFTAVELTRALTVDGRNLSYDRICKWVQRGMLEPHQQLKWWRGKIESVQAYRLGDVRQLVTELERRRGTCATVRFVPMPRIARARKQDEMR